MHEDAVGRRSVPRTGTTLYSFTPEYHARRYDVKVITALDGDADVSLDQGHALLRIAGEAIRNAVRHGGAQRVAVALTADPLTLAVTDDGSGFAADDAATGRPGGFGLTSMRERAASVGADFSISSTAGEGTTVAVSWQ